MGMQSSIWRWRRGVKEGLLLEKWGKGFYGNREPVGWLFGSCPLFGKINIPIPSWAVIWIPSTIWENKYPNSQIGELFGPGWVLPQFECNLKGQVVVSWPLWVKPFKAWQVHLHKGCLRLLPLKHKTELPSLKKKTKSIVIQTLEQQSELLDLGV